MGRAELPDPLDGRLQDRWAPGRRRRRNGIRIADEAQAPLRVVCIGGGTGLPVVLRGLSRRAGGRAGRPRLSLTAVVAMSDDGGSSGRLRRHLGALPPGDVRNCLVALSATPTPLSEALQHRFRQKGGLRGHAVGNLMLAALAEVTGDFTEAVRVLGEVLGARGRVLPSTLDPVELVAHKSEGVEIVGERNLARVPGRIHSVALVPARPRPVPGLLDAIREADLVTLGPGSLYSSALPNLMVDGVAQALRETSALRVLVGNLMTQPGETDGMDCAAHVRALIDHVGPVVDAVLVNGRLPPDARLAGYASEGSVPVTLDRRALLELGVAPIEADLLMTGQRIRHDGGKVARCLLSLATHGL